MCLTVLVLMWWWQPLFVSPLVHDWQSQVMLIHATRLSQAFPRGHLLACEMPSILSHVHDNIIKHTRTKHANTFTTAHGPFNYLQMWDGDDLIILSNTVDLLVAIQNQSSCIISHHSWCTIPLMEAGDSGSSTAWIWDSGTFTSIVRLRSGMNLHRRSWRLCGTPCTLMLVFTPKLPHCQQCSRSSFNSKSHTPRCELVFKKRCQRSCLRDWRLLSATSSFFLNLLFQR